MVQLNDILKQPDLIAKILFWLGGIFAGLVVLFYVIKMDQIDIVYEIQFPFGMLFLLLIVLIVMVLIFILTNLLFLLKSEERLRYFNPVTRAIILFLILAVIISINWVGYMVYNIIRIVSTG